ncbi:MAG: DUF445 domain-containing protein [Burkholderiaceae bacterium]|jgi:uncharacterized membrane-anchored protein YjiN (DUF445 family)|nr:DUF445 domain-containing protein [Burkholderiaceae bacterium]
MSDTTRRRQLNGMKWFATGLMLVMAVVLVFSRLQGEQGFWHWVRAFSEAALIGALADWFAVVAIFKHPMKLPIPRTAIIPRNKERIAENLAIFIRENFLAVDTIVEKMRALYPAQRIGIWISTRETADMLARNLIGILTGALNFVDDQRVGKILRNTIHKQLKQTDLGNLIGQLVDVLTKNNQHQALLNEILRRLSTVLDEIETQRQVAGIIIDVSRKEYPKLIGMLGIIMDTEEFGMKLAATLVESMQNWLHDIGVDPSHPRRKQFDLATANFIGKIKQDPTQQKRIEEWKQHFLATPVVSNYFETLWIQLRHWLLKEASYGNSRLHIRLSHGLRHFGRWILEHPALCESINDQLLEITKMLSGDLRDSVSRHIISTITSWDDRALVDELETTVGRDLQFIRINGTLVGGIIGVALHALVLLSEI